MTVVRRTFEKYSGTVSHNKRKFRSLLLVNSITGLKINLFSCCLPPETCNIDCKAMSVHTRFLTRMSFFILSLFSNSKPQFEKKKVTLALLFVLCRSYLDERIARDAAFSDALAADAKDLQVIAGLGTKEAANIEDDVKEKAYRKLLREEFTSGRLDAAASKAEVLGELVDRVQWDSEAALELHKSLYRQKLSSLLEKKTLTDGDAEELARLQRLLCVPNEQKELIHRELCGSLFRDAVSSALGAGIDHFGFEDRAAVKSAFEGLRLDRSVAKDILAEVARKYLLQFVSMSRNQRDRIAAAKELKKMVLFSNIVVAPLVEDLKTEEEKKKEEEEAKQQKELQELMAKAREEAAKEAAEKEKAESSKESEGQKPADEVTDTDKESVSAASDATASETQGQIEAQTEAQIETEKEKQEGEDEVKPKSLEKAQAAAASRSGGEKIESSGIVMKSQKDVTLAQDLELRDRLDIYRNFLLYCMTGDVVQGPMGVTMVTERDETEFARLSQLGDVLGLTQMDVYQVHQGLAEQAFKSQVQQTMGTGPLTAERAAALESVRSQMGLPKEAADKIIKGLQNQKLIAAMQEAKAQGNLTLDKVLEMKEAGVEPSSLMTKDGLQALYRSEIASRLSDGTGDFDSNRLLNELPGDLGLDSDRAGKVVKELASERKRATLVQAVSFLRQKKFSDTVKSLNNLRACAAALPDSGPEIWSEREEVADLYGLYCSKENDAERRASLQAVLGLTDEDASSLQTIVESGQFKLGLESEEEAEAFF